MQCPACRSEVLVKAGIQSQKQRYKCKPCGRLFVERGRPGYSNEIKEQALAMYLEGLGFRAIGRLLGVCNVAVLKWVRKAAQNLTQPKKSPIVDVLEMDELWHFIKKRAENSGCGLRLTVNDAPSLTSKQVAVVYKPYNLCGNG